MNLSSITLGRSSSRANPSILRGMTSESDLPRTAGDDWRAAARAAVQHLADPTLPQDVAAALRALVAALEADEDGAAAPLAASIWPVLTQTAQVHGTVFRPGTSTQAIVAEAIRYYEFEQQPPRVASRASILDRFGAQVGALTSEKAEAND